MTRRNRHHAKSYNKTALTPVSSNKEDFILQLQEIPLFQNYTECIDIEDIKHIKKIEQKTIRSSYEYRKYIEYLKKTMNMNRCSYLPNIISGIGNLKIEIHHSPFTLFDITTVVCNKHIMVYGSANEFKVADEVMRLHYMNHIGLIPLSPTIHELYSEDVDVHPKLVYGNWKEFIKEYHTYFTRSIVEKQKRIFASYDRPLNAPQQMLEKRNTVIAYNYDKQIYNAISFNKL